MPPAIQFNLRHTDPVQLLLIRELVGKSSDAEFLRERRELGASIARRKAVAAERTYAKEQAEAEAAEAIARKEQADVVEAERALAEQRAKNADAAAIRMAEEALAKEKAETAAAAQRAAKRERAKAEPAATAAARERAEADVANAEAAEQARLARLAKQQEAAANLAAQQKAQEDAAAAAADAAPKVRVGDLLSEGQEPITDPMFEACREFVSDLTRFETMYDGKAMSLHKDANNLAGGGENVTGFITVAKPAPIPAATYWKIKDDIRFIRSIDSGIMEFVDLEKNGTTTRCYYSYKMPPGLKNRDFMVQAETRIYSGEYVCIL